MTEVLHLPVPAAELIPGAPASAEPYSEFVGCCRVAEQAAQQWVHSFRCLPAVPWTEAWNEKCSPSAPRYHGLAGDGAGEIPHLFPRVLMCRCPSPLLVEHAQLPDKTWLEQRTGRAKSPGRCLHMGNCWKLLLHPTCFKLSFCFNTIFFPWQLEKNNFCYSEGYWK